MAAGKISIQANDGKVAGVVFEDGASGNVTVTVPKEGGVVATEAYADTKVSKTGDETIAGVKTFSDGIKLQNQNVSPFSGFKNYIINGNFDVWQRGTSFSIGYTGVSGYHTDRFTSASTFLTGSVRIDKSSITYNNVKYNSAKCTVTTAYNTSGSSSAYRHFCYFFEGIDSTVVNKGFTLSFLFNTNVAGTYTVSFRCEGNIVSTYKTRITAISGVQKITIVVPANTITTPNLDANMGLQIYIAGVAGSTYGNLSTTLNQWDSSITTLYYPNEMNWAGTVDNYVEIAQVQLEEGSVATPFEQRPYGLELSLCQRYYESSYSNGVTVGSASTLGAKYSITTGSATAQGFTFIEPKRVPPTVAIYSPSGTAGYVWSNADIDNGSTTPSNIGTKGVRYLNNAINNWTANSSITYHYTASAEL